VSPSPHAVAPRTLPVLPPSRLQLTHASFWQSHEQALTSPFRVGGQRSATSGLCRAGATSLIDPLLLVRALGDIRTDPSVCETDHIARLGTRLEHLQQLQPRNMTNVFKGSRLQLGRSWMHAPSNAVGGARPCTWSGPFCSPCSTVRGSTSVGGQRCHGLRNSRRSSSSCSSICHGLWRQHDACCARHARVRGTTYMFCC
jgi:hypothetical protein